MADLWNVMTEAEAKRAGIRHFEYRRENVPFHDFKAVVDALLWVKGRLAISACLTLEDGRKAHLLGYRNNGYSGLKELPSGERASVSVGCGPNGGFHFWAAKADGFCERISPCGPRGRVATTQFQAHHM